MKTIEKLREVIQPARAAAAGAVRRMAITLTSKALWQLAGHEVNGVREAVPAEPFTGIGHAARPPASGTPEAIVVMVGDGRNPMIIAVRDEKTRAAIAGALGADETMMFNSQSLVHVKANGTIEARSAGGTAVALATKADLEALRDSIAAWVPVGTDGGAALKARLTTDGIIAGSWPAGTSKLKGE